MGAQLWKKCLKNQRKSCLSGNQKINPSKHEISAVTDKGKWQKKGVDIVQAELQFLETVRNAAKEPKKEDQSRESDPNYHFAMMLYAELSKFSTRNQHIVCHKILNLLFDIQMQEHHEQAFSRKQAWAATSTDRSAESFLVGGRKVPVLPQSQARTRLLHDNFLYQKVIYSQ